MFVDEDNFFLRIDSTKKNLYSGFGKMINALLKLLCNILKMSDIKNLVLKSYPLNLKYISLIETFKYLEHFT